MAVAEGTLSLRKGHHSELIYERALLRANLRAKALAGLKVIILREARVRRKEGGSVTSALV